MKKVICYFSGTGNSMRAAVKIAEAMHDTELISMRCNPTDVSAADADVIGFTFPIYHWMLAEPISSFIKALNINPKAYIFAVSTPGFVNGLSFEMLENILESKGAHLAYGKKAIGYELPQEWKERFRGDPFVMCMKLPDSRKRYHNPYIEANDLIKDKMHIE